jgi:hypothetical protein
MSYRPFHRALGYQPGVQVNPLIDNTDGAAISNTDQIIGALARLPRGRIDRPIRVNRGNFATTTGQNPTPLRASALNEARIQIYESLRAGAFEFVVQRLTGSNTVNRYAVLRLASGAALSATVSGGVITAITITQGGVNYVTGQTLAFGGPGSGAKGTVIATNGAITGVTIINGGFGYTTAPTVTVAENVSWTAEDTMPTSGYVLAIEDKNCWNDGIKLSLHAASTDTATPMASTDVVLRISDPATGEVVREFAGSLDSAALDDFNSSQYLPDVAAMADESYIISVAAGAVIPVTASCYGTDANGRAKWGTSVGAVVLFSEGTTGYTESDFIRCVNALVNGDLPFGYLISAGTQSVSLLTKLAEAAVDANTQFLYDVPGTLGKDAAIAFHRMLGFDSHLVQAYWAPIEAIDPLNGGRAIWGTSGLQAGMRAKRNAQRNAKGFAPKQYPIAGKDYPVQRAGMRKTVTLTDSDESELAKFHLNPVSNKNYGSGDLYVFTDQLTSARTDVSKRKLITVAERSVDLEWMVAAYCQQLIHLPLQEAVHKANAFFDHLSANAAASDWLRPAAQLQGRSMAWEVTADENRADRIAVRYWASFDGNARQFFITPYLSK